MMKLSAQIGLTLEVKRKELKKLEQEINKLADGQLQARRNDVFWPEKVTSKSLRSSVMKARILRSILTRYYNAKDNGRTKAKKATSFLISSKLIWKILWQMPSMPVVRQPPSFRKILDELQKDELLKYNSDKRKWKLTQKGYERIIKKPRRNGEA